MKFADSGSFKLAWLISECKNKDQMSAYQLAWNFRTGAECLEDLPRDKHSSWKHQGHKGWAHAEKKSPDPVNGPCQNSCTLPVPQHGTSKLSTSDFMPTCISVAEQLCEDLTSLRKSVQKLLHLPDLPDQSRVKKISQTSDTLWTATLIDHWRKKQS